MRALIIVAAIGVGVPAWAADPFIQALDQQARDHGGATASRVGEPVRGYKDHTDWTAQLSPNTCYLFEARASEGVRRISLFLWSPDGKRVATDKSKPPLSMISTLRYCSTWLGAFHVQAKIEGAGPYVVGTYVVPGGKPGATPPPLVVAPPPPYASPAPPPVVYPPPPQPIYVAPPPVYVTPAPVYVAPAPRTVIIMPSTSGSICKSSLDCGSGEFCKENSDGIRVCMGRGGRGAACSSSIDCDSGLFCKDRGDDFNVCM